MSVTPPPDRRLAGRYALHDRVEQGTVGLVLRATDTMLRREVAVKEVPLRQPGLRAGQAGLRERLLREVRAAARVVNQGFVTIFDVIEEAGRLYLVTELVPGRSLRDLVASEGTLPPDRVARLGATLLAALTAAHRRGLVHHDVQPGNVLVLPDGRVKLCDLGVAFLRPGPSFGNDRGEAPTETQDGDLRALGATLRFAAGDADGPLGRAIDALRGAGPARPVRVGALQDVLDQLGASTPAAHIQVHLQAPPAAPQPEPERPVPWIAPNAPVGAEPATPATGPARRSPPSDAGKVRGWWVPATVLVLACIALAAAALGRSDGRDGAAGGAGAPAPASSSAPAARNRAPVGWQAVEDAQSGFGIAIPPGWELVQDRTGGLAFRDQATGSTARIQHTDAPAPQPDSEPRRSERTYLATGPYRRIKLDSTTFRGQPAAEWEFTFTRDGVDWHAADLYFIAGGRGYWLSFQTHAERWSAAAPTLEALRGSFRLLTETGS